MNKIIAKVNKTNFFALLALVFLLPLLFCPYIDDSFALPKVVFLRIILFIFFACWLIKILEKKEFVFHSTPLNRPLLFYFIVAIICTVFSSQPRASFFGMYHYYFEGLLAIISYLFLYFFILHNFNLSSLKILIRTIFVSTILVCIYGILQYFKIDFVSWASPSIRIFSTLGNPNFLGAYLVLILPLTLTMILKEETKIARIFSSFLFILICATLSLTLSRASILGAALAIILWFSLINKNALRQRKSYFAWLLGILILVPLGMYFLTSGEISLKERIFSIFDFSELDISSRISGWKSALLMFKDRPIFGWGLDSFYTVFRQYMLPEYEHLTIKYATAGYAHNEFLQILATTGIVGFGAYLWILITFFSKTIKKRNSIDGPYLVGFISSCAGLLLANQFGFSTICPAVFFWLFISLSMLILKETNDFSVPYRKTLNISEKAIGAIYATLVFLFSFFIVFQINHLRADRYYALGKAYQEKNSNFEAIKNYEKATSLNPYQPIYFQDLGRLWTQEILNAQSIRERKNSFEQALNNYQRYLKFLPYDAMGYNGRGVSYMYAAQTLNQDYYQQAIKDLEKAVQLSPNFVDAQINLGAAYYSWSKIKNDEELKKQAFQIYQDALKIDPYKPNLYFNLGNMYALEGDTLTAISYWKQTLNLDLSFTQAQTNIDYFEKNFEKNLDK